VKRIIEDQLGQLDLLDRSDGITGAHVRIRLPQYLVPDMTAVNAQRTEIAE
jgi:nitrogen fixation/metabolism regulation signal transduction histidine kinase